MADLEASRFGVRRKVDRDFVYKIICNDEDEPIQIPKTIATMSMRLRKLYEDSKQANLKAIKLDLDQAVFLKVKAFMEFTKDNYEGRTGVISQDKLNLAKQKMHEDIESMADVLPIVRAGHYLKLDLVYKTMRKDVLEAFDQCDTPSALRKHFKLESMPMRQRIKSTTHVGLNTKPLKHPDPQEVKCYMCKPDKPDLTTGNRHTCRKCFHLTCAEHTGKGILPVKEKEKAEKLIDRHVLSKLHDHLKSPIQWVAGTDPGETNLCRHCCNRLDKHIVTLVKEFRACFDLPRLQKIVEFAPCDPWTTAARICIADLFSLQCRLPTHKLQSHEQWMLLLNAEHLACHSSWSFLVLSAYHTANKSEEEALRFLDTDIALRKPCKKVGCFKQCSPKMSFLNAVLLVADFQEIKYPKIRSLAVQVLQQETPEGDVLTKDLGLSIYLPLLTHALGLEEMPQTSELFNLLCRNEDITFRTDLYWWLRVQGEADAALGRKFRRLHSMMVAKIAAGHSEESAMNVIYSQQLIDAIHEAACATQKGGITNSASVALAVKQKLKEECADLPFNQKGSVLPVPLFPNMHVVGIDVEKVKVMVSNIKPIVVPLKVKDASRRNEEVAPLEVLSGSNISRDVSNSAGATTLRVLYKLEDVRKDSVACRLIQFMIQCVPFDAIQGLLHQEQHFRENQSRVVPVIEDYLISYKVVPVSAESGLIQWIENATTIFDIGKGDAQNFGLKKFLGEPQGALDPGAYEKTYIFTCTLAIYTVFSYLLGAGDRHKGNLMVSELGSFFHIDFGWLLGEDPKPRYMTRRLAISREMVEVFGREDSQYYQLLETVAGKVFISLRKHFHEISTLLLFLKLTKPTVDIRYTAVQIEDELAARFAVGIPDDQADRVIKKWIHDEVVQNHYAADAIHHVAIYSGNWVPTIVRGLGTFTEKFTAGVHKSVQAYRHAMTQIRPINGISNLTDVMDVYIFDQFGTIHDGHSALPDVDECFQQLLAKKKEIYILSKSKQTGEKLKQNFDMAGFSKESLASDKVRFLTYGDITYNAITSECKRGMKCCAIVSNDQENICADLAEKYNIEFTIDAEEADFLYICGTDGIYKSPTETVDRSAMFEQPELLIPFLSQCQRKNKLMFVGGPDAPDDSRKQPSDIADLYEQCQIDDRNEKPPVIVKRANTKASQLSWLVKTRVTPKTSKDKIVMVGDTLLSDVRPAYENGIKSVFITTGNEEEIGLEPAEELSQQKSELATYFHNNGVEPTYCVKRLCWQA